MGSAAGRKRQRWRSDLVGFAFVAPSAVVLVAFMAVPFAQALLLSLNSWDGIHAEAWVGLDNYRALLADRIFWLAVVNTAFFTAATTMLEVVIALVVASALNARIGAGFFRAIYFMPFVISGAISGLIWGMVLDANFGAFNDLLRSIGLGQLAHPWLADRGTVMPSLVAISVWQSFGFYVVILSAAMQAIPRSIMEAAAIDGVTAVQRLRLITIPMLRTPITVSLALGAISGIQAFDQIWVMTGGGPNHASETLGTYLYKLAFGGGIAATSELGYAAALAVVILALSLAVSVVLISRRGRNEFEY